MGSRTFVGSSSLLPRKQTLGYLPEPRVCYPLPAVTPGLCQPSLSSCFPAPGGGLSFLFPKLKDSLPPSRPAPRKDFPSTYSSLLSPASSIGPIPVFRTGYPILKKQHGHRIPAASSLRLFGQQNWLRDQSEVDPFLLSPWPGFPALSCDLAFLLTKLLTCSLQTPLTSQRPNPRASRTLFPEITRALILKTQASNIWS